MSLLFALQTLAQTPKEKLKALNIELPVVKAPVASFIHVERLGGETTAYETGIFHFTSRDATGKLLSESYTHLEELLVKQSANRRWKTRFFPFSPSLQQNGENTPQKPMACVF